MSHAENSDSRHHVNNNVESNPSRRIQSTRDRQNMLSATNTLGITDETTYPPIPSCTQSNDTISSAQTNSTIPNIHSNANLPNIQGFDFGGSSLQSNATISGTQNINFTSSSQSNDIGSRAYMSHYVRRTLSGLTDESWAQYRARYPTSNHLQKVHPNVIEYTQVRPHWYRVVSIDVNSADSNESYSSQPQKVQRTANGRRSTAGVTNTQSDVEWYRRVNRDVIESQKTLPSSRSERLERRSESQYPTLPLSSIQAHSNHSHPTSSVNNILQADSQNEPILLNKRSNESVGYQSNNVIHTMNSPTLDCPIQNLNSDQSSAVLISINSEPNTTQDTTPSSAMTNNSNHAQVLIDLDDFDNNTEDQPLSVPPISSNAVNPNPENNVIGSIPNLTDSPIINEPETLEVVIRSRNYADYNVVISNPTIIRMHKILQRSILSSNNTNSPANSTILYQQVNNYMQVLRNTILSTDTNSSSVSSLMSVSVPRSLTIDQSSYPLLDNTSEMPPITIIDRIQNGCVVKELTNCAICLEENNGNVFLEPCKHYNMCGPCMERLTSWICPICRSHITNIIVYV
uniref:RING-type domain-containing protein n=1 Tax=Schizaphis graminum TaxID=13262 RepID=A0A2S2NTP3_SCHGA